jgi:hypothetical protein
MKSRFRGLTCIGHGCLNLFYDSICISSRILFQLGCRMLPVLGCRGIVLTYYSRHLGYGVRYLFGRDRVYRKWSTERLELVFKPFAMLFSHAVIHMMVRSYMGRDPEAGRV